MIIFNYRGHRYEADDRFLETGLVIVEGKSLQVLGGWIENQPHALYGTPITEQNRDKFVTATRINISGGA